MKKKLSHYKLSLIKLDRYVDKRQVWEQAKRDLSFRDYCELLNFLSKQKQYDYVFNLDEILRDVKDLTAPRRDLVIGRSAKERDVLSDLLGVLGYLNLCAEKVDYYYDLKDSFEKCILVHDIEGCSNKLTDIEQLYGISFWLIEAKFLANNYREVANAEKYYLHLKRSCEDNEYIKEFIRCINKRTSGLIKFDEAKWFIENKKAKLRILCKRDELTLEEYTYFEFYNSYHQNNSDNLLEQLHLLLSFCDYLSIIDLYNLVDRIVSIFLVDKSVSNTSKDILMKAIKGLCFRLSCSATLATTFDYSIEHNPLTLKMYEMFRIFHKDFSQCYCECIKNLEEFPNEFDLILTESQLNVLLSTGEEIVYEKSLLFEIQQILVCALKKDVHYNQFVPFEDKAAKLLYQLLNTSLFFAYRNFYLDCYSDEADIYSEYSYITSKYYNVKSRFNASNPNLFSKKRLCVVDWFKFSAQSEGLEYDKISLMVKQLGSASLDELKLILTHGYPDLTLEQNKVIKTVAYESYFNKLVEAGNYLEAVSLYVDCAFKSKALARSFAIKKLIGKMRPKDIEGMYGRIDFCIFADMIDLKGNPSIGFNYHACNSLEVILQRERVALPSELKVPLGAEKRFSYIFRHVCTERLLEYYVKYNLDSFAGQDIDEIFILQERKRLLQLALVLDYECEKKQIQTQLENVTERILRLQLFLPNKEKIDAHRISKAEIRDINNDVRFLMQLSDLLTDFHIRGVPFIEEGYILIKEHIIDYKKIYFSSIDGQIGINVRHGFFSNEILKFLNDHGILILKKEEKDDFSNSDLATIQRKITQLKKINRPDLIDQAEAIWGLSKRIYDFIETELEIMKIVSTSKSSIAEGKVFNIYIEESDIFAIAEKIFSFENPYKIQKILWEEFDDITERIFVQIRLYVRQKIFTCLGDFCREARAVYGLKNHVSEADINSLATSIAEWFSFYDDGSKKCSVGIYLKELKKKHAFLNLVSQNDTGISLTLEQIHILDIILENLIFNAVKHSALESQLRIDLSYVITVKEVILTIKNPLGEVDIDNIVGGILVVENYIRKKKLDRSFEDSLTGKGYKHIVQELYSDFVEDNSWDIVFNKDLLPKQFEVEVNFKWKVESDV